MSQSNKNIFHLQSTPILFKGTVLENICLTNQVEMSRVISLLSRFRLMELLVSLFDDSDFLLKTRSLS